MSKWRPIEERKKGKAYYQRMHRSKDRMRYRNYYKEWRENNPEKVIANRKSTRDKLRSDVLESYGNKCACCGETEPKFLSIDHINGNGAIHKKSLGLKSAQAFYTWLRKNNYPKDNFQILCHNCNLAKGFYGRCPHKEKKH